MGYPGIELQWQTGMDDNWVSYYEIIRNGTPIDKVAHGTFYFDHSAGADLAARYEIRTVDGSGNVSAGVVASGLPARPSDIIDDAMRDKIRFSGLWTHVKEEPRVAYDGTLSFASA